MPVPDTVAEHWLVLPVWMLVGVQATATEVIVEDDAATVTIAVPDFVESWVLVAVIVDLPDEGAVAGAVYSPELEIVPESTDQLTAEL